MSCGDKFDQDTSGIQPYQGGARAAEGGVGLLTKIPIYMCGVGSPLIKTPLYSVSFFMGIILGPEQFIGTEGSSNILTGFFLCVLLISGNPNPC